MSTTTLYQALTEAGASKDLAKQAVHDAFEDLVTKDYLNAELKTIKVELAKLESRLTTRMLIFAGIIIAAVGLIVKL